MFRKCSVLINTYDAYWLCMINQHTYCEKNPACKKLNLYRPLTTRQVLYLSVELKISY